MTEVVGRPRTRLVVTDPLLFERSAGTTYALNPRTATRVRLGPAVLPWVTGQREADEAPTAVRRQLIEAGLFVPASDTPGGIDSASQDSLPTPWQYWGPLAWAFHAHTQDVRFIRRDSEALGAWQAELLADAPPEPTRLTRRKHEASALMLPRVRRDIRMPLADVLENRRTHRTFDASPVTLDDLSTILHYVFAPMRFADARELGTLELRSYISGGARHETTAVVIAFDVEGIPSGVYVYDQLRHGLVTLDCVADRTLFDELTGGQGFYDASSFSVITVADSAAMAWKYRHARAYRHLMNNVGAFAQVFSMTCHALGLGAAVTGALRDSACADLLQLDTPREFATFSLTCGHPATGRSDLPADFRPASEPYQVTKGYRQGPDEPGTGV